MADIRNVGDPIFEIEDNLAAYKTKDDSGDVWLRVGSDWHLLSPSEAVKLSVAVSNYAYPRSVNRK